MKTIELNGVTLYLTDKTAVEVEHELNREREERRAHWYLWHWFARRWAMYGDQYGDGSMFSDLYKDENGFRPRLTRDEVFWTLYKRECWFAHGLRGDEHRRMSRWL